jgi:tetratricopeptide (TPR) repeat protein
VTAAAFSLACIVALLLPWSYAAARVRHDVARFGELIDLSRIGEARTSAHRLLALDAAASWREAPLSRLAADLDRAVRELTQRVVVPLAAEATSDERLERARQLAMLGRTAEAGKVLSSLEGPEAISLQATIHENQGEWDAALNAYSKARAAWQSQPASAAQASGLITATRGIAYSQRKSGRYAEAEATYQELLALAPTAESHFLLAQFYEDAQHSQQASLHARRAMALAPDAYREPGQQLIRKLQVYHFGCLGVPRAGSE